MERGRGRNIISVKMSEITDTRILAQGICLLFAQKTLISSCFFHCKQLKAHSDSTQLTCGAFVLLQNAIFVTAGYPA